MNFGHVTSDQGAWRIECAAHVRRTVVSGELDWSPGVHEQCIGRVARDGQTDPVVADVLGVKRGQIEGVRDPNGALIERLDRESGNLKRLAAEYLK